jgi:fluoride exporter
VTAHAAYLAAGSLAGGFARWGVYLALQRPGSKIPAATFLINMLGCLLIGLFEGLAQTRSALSPEARLLLMTGFCGCFTTFSTFIHETSGLLDAGRPASALGYVLLSVLLGFALFRLGHALANLG